MKNQLKGFTPWPRLVVEINPVKNLISSCIVQQLRYSMISRRPISLLLSFDWRLRSSILRTFWRPQSSTAYVEDFVDLDTNAVPMMATTKEESATIRRTRTWKGAAAKTPPMPYVSFGGFEQQVKRELERLATEQKLMLQMLPRFSALLNGLRPNELTVFTGPTGCGKTTVLSQMSLDYALQGIPVLWGSFEIRNARLAQVMLQQLAMRPLSKGNQLDMAAFEEASQKLRQMPINFMKLFGSTGLDTVLDTMEFSMTQPLPPTLIILDNLQFMLSGQANNALDKWELMDRAIANLRAFCNAYAVHLILVVHPRKEMDDTPLGLASVSGTAKATQEADNVIILQKIGEKRFLEVKKNRYYGDLGRVRIGYLADARLVSEIVEDERRQPTSGSTNENTGESLEDAETDEFETTAAKRSAR